jgi:hypothetical protein
MIKLTGAVFAASLSLIPGAGAAEPSLEGTYRLISSSRTVVETGQVQQSFGESPVGFIMYGRDGRMMVLMVRGDRPKPNFQTITDAQKVALFDSMAAYGGTYTFDGHTVTHHIDISGNEILTGSNAVRDVSFEGQRLIYRTRPGPSPTDGKISTSEVIWERLPGPPASK